MGTPVSAVGGTINGIVGVLDEGRQVALEDKPLTEAVVDIGSDTMISAAFTSMGTAAKKTAKGSEEQMHDIIIDGYSIGLTVIMQWVADKVIVDSKKNETERDTSR
jgi:hypothetical protein